MKKFFVCIFLLFTSIGVYSLEPKAEAQATEESVQQYATVFSKNYTIWKDLSWEKASNSKMYFQSTLKVKKRYIHPNEEKYVELYNQQGQKVGILNEKAVRISSAAQGVAIPQKKYISVLRRGYSTYSNFQWKKKGTSTPLYQKTYRTISVYSHYNGKKFYSIEDKNGKWQGYLSEAAIQIAKGGEGVGFESSGLFTVKKKSYPCYKNFSWEKTAQPYGMVGKVVETTKKYVHFNGETYYKILSAYVGNKGYINQKAISSNLSVRMNLPYYSQLKAGAQLGCAPTSLYTALRYKGYAKKTSLHSIIANLPLSSNNPDVGQIGYPFGTIANFGAVISPIGLSKYAKRWTSHIQVLTGSSLTKVNQEVLQYHPVLFWGVHNLGDAYWKSYAKHVMIIYGYQKIGTREYYAIQDPGFYSGSDSRARRWVSKAFLDNYLSSKGRKMMVVR